MRKKLVALDIDGTTADSRGNVCGRVLDAIRAARAQGHIVCFVTGRADTDIVAIDEAVQLVDYVVLNNGAKIVRVSDGKVLANELIDAKEAGRLILYGLKKNFHIYLIDGKDWYVNRCTAGTDAYAQEVGSLPHLFSDLSQIPLHHIEGFTIVGDAHRICKFVQDQGYRLRAVASQKDCVDILNRGSDKWNGIKKLLCITGIGRDDVIAVGDYDNDIEMICHAGTGVAVANASEQVRRTADYVAVHDNDHGAAADVIEQFVLGKNTGLCRTMV